MENKETFHYTYCAEEQEEIRNIRSKYAAPEENKLEQLRRLDAGVTRKAEAAALALGIIGALVLGMGMSLVLTELRISLGLGQVLSMALGIVIGVIGLGMVCYAYPLYERMVKKERDRIAPEILRLTDELLK